MRESALRLYGREITRLPLRGITESGGQHDGICQFIAGATASYKAGNNEDVRALL